MLTGHAHWNTVMSSRTTHSAAPWSSSSSPSGAANAESVWQSPPAAYIQPSADDGRCHAIRAPHRAKLTPMRMLLTTNPSSASLKVQPTDSTQTTAPAAASTAETPSALASSLPRITHLLRPRLTIPPPTGVPPGKSSRPARGSPRPVGNRALSAGPCPVGPLLTTATLEGICTMTNTSRVAGRQIGLAIFGLLSLGDIATLALTDGETPPYAVAAVAAALGLVSLLLAVQALRDPTKPLRLLIGLRVLSAVTAVPRSSSADVPAGAGRPRRHRRPHRRRRGARRRWSHGGGDIMTATPAPARARSIPLAAWVVALLLPIGPGRDRRAQADPPVLHRERLGRNGRRGRRGPGTAECSALAGVHRHPHARARTLRRSPGLSRGAPRV